MKFIKHQETWIDVSNIKKQLAKKMLPPLRLIADKLKLKDR